MGASIGPTPGDTGPSAQPVVTFGSGRQASSPPDLRILHYNDVYHLDPSSAEPVGGVARFISVCKEYREDPRFAGQPGLVTFFSGDVFNPSLESSVTKGSHMVPILNNIGTDCASVGNHDLDFGVKQFRHLTSKCNFPWLVANILDPDLGENVPIGNASRTHMITASNGIKIGLVGLGEREWLETVNSIPPNLIYRSATQVAKELVPQLRAEGADIIIALTHMREPNDNKLAENMGGEIDIILGGHDHYYAHSYINGTHVLRSGSDFKQLSYLELRRSESRPGRWDIDIWRRDVVSSLAEDRDTLRLVDKLTSKLKRSLEKPVGWTSTPLDSRFTTVRRRESNIGNFVCDVMRHHYQGDCAIIAAGTIRGDQVYSPGPVKLRDITNCFPFEDPVVVIKATGKAIRGALENSVSLYPALEGRFPQVSNIKFTFDPSKPPGSRILSVEIGSGPLEPDRTYTLVTRGYMGRGKDGYQDLLVESEGGQCEEVISEESGVLISTLLRQYFMALKILRQWSNWGPSLARHWGRVVSGVGQCHPVPRPAESQSRVVPVIKISDQSLEAGDLSGWAQWTAAKLRQRRASLPPADEGDDDDDSDAGVDENTSRQSEDIERELEIMRRVFRKWCRRAGVYGESSGRLEDQAEVEVNWTQPIAPKLEGRIHMVGEGD